MRLLLPLIFFGAGLAVCFGQSTKTVKPDLTGTWQLESPRHSSSNSPNKPPEQIKITHHDPELIIRRKVQIKGVPQEQDLTYYTDRRGETNPTTEWVTSNPGDETYRPMETKSQTSWNKNKVVTRSVSRPFARATSFEFEIVDEWRLSEDGKTLTLTTRTNPQSNSSANAVFAGPGTDIKRVYKLISK